jgi:hypothetical protein
MLKQIRTASETVYAVEAAGFRLELSEDGTCVRIVGDGRLPRALVVAVCEHRAVLLESLTPPDLGALPKTTPTPNTTQETTP